MSGSLRAKTALVTRSAGGIEQAVAWALAEAGAGVESLDGKISSSLTSLATRTRPSHPMAVGS
jgi:NAD(P)-dependent dehydrogenase (short-subunit alcohol dehydrogenase family)